MLMCLSLETLISIIRTSYPILVKLIDLVKFFIIFLPQMTLLRWLTFLLRSLCVTFTDLLFWIYFYLLLLIFVLQWLSLHWIMFMVFSCLCCCHSLQKSLFSSVPTEQPIQQPRGVVFYI